MIDKIIGFIGAGNMGSAMIGGIVHSELVTTSQIIASAHSAATLEKLQSTYSIETTPVSYTHLRAHETDSYLVCRLLLEKKKIAYTHLRTH